MKVNVIEIPEYTQLFFAGKDELQNKKDTANALAKEISAYKQLLLQHNLNTCCAELHEIARHIWSRESVLFPPSKEEKEKKNQHIIRPKSALIFSADPLGVCFPGQACEH